MFDTLTSMRFIAAACVLFHHAAADWGYLVFFNIMDRLGWLGVSFFFILSGFVLMWSFDPLLPYGSYLLRRLSRIYPLHVACLAASLLCFLRFGQPLGGYIGTGPGTVANLFLVHDWIAGHPEIRQAWNGVSWTLSCEFFFYLVAPVLFTLLLGISAIRLVRLVVALWFTELLIILLAQATDANSVLDFMVYDPLPRLFEFLLGAAGARWVRAGTRFRSVPASLAIMLIPVLAYGLILPADWQCPDVLIPLFVPGAFLIIIAAAGNELDGATSWLRHPVLVRVGEASFALYMVHALLLGAYSILIAPACRAFFVNHPWVEDVSALLYFLAAVLLAIAVHRWFEQPARRFILRHEPKQQAVAFLHKSSAKNS